MNHLGFGCERLYSIGIISVIYKVCNLLTHDNNDMIGKIFSYSLCILMLEAQGNVS